MPLYYYQCNAFYPIRLFACICIIVSTVNRVSIGPKNLCKRWLPHNELRKVTISSKLCMADSFC